MKVLLLTRYERLGASSRVRFLQFLPRLEQAGFEETATFEQIVWDSPVSFDRARVRELFSLHWLAQQENVIFCGPVGVGTTFLACALGHSA